VRTARPRLKETSCGTSAQSISGYCKVNAMAPRCSLRRARKHAAAPEDLGPRQPELAAHAEALGQGCYQLPTQVRPHTKVAVPTTS